MSMCRVFSCVVGRGCLLWPVHSLGKTLLAFALLHSIFQGQICLLTPGVSWLPTSALLLSWVQNLKIDCCNCQNHCQFTIFKSASIITKSITAIPTATIPTTTTVAATKATLTAEVSSTTTPTITTEVSRTTSTSLAGWSTGHLLLVCCVLSHFSRVLLCDPMDCSPLGSSVHGFSRQGSWCGLPFPSPGDLPDPGIEPSSLTSPALQ